MGSEDKIKQAYKQKMRVLLMLTGLLLVGLLAVEGSNCNWGEPCFRELFSYGCWKGLCWKQCRSGFAYIRNVNYTDSEYDMGTSWCFLSDGRAGDFVHCDDNDHSGCKVHLKGGCVDHCY